MNSTKNKTASRGNATTNSSEKEEIKTKNETETLTKKHSQSLKDEQNQNKLYDRKGRPMILTNAQRRAGMTPGQVAAEFTFAGGLELLIAVILIFLSLIYIIGSW